MGTRDKDDSTDMPTRFGPVAGRAGAHYDLDMRLRSATFRLYPTNAQEQTLAGWLGMACEFYNAALQERRDAWRMNRVRVTGYDQITSIPAVKAVRPEFSALPAHVLQNVCLRLDKAFAAFFRRVKAGEKPGYPRFRSRRRYDSLCFPDPLRSKNLTDRAVKVPKLGWLRWRPYKAVAELGRVKTLTVKRLADGWYATVACEVEARAALPATGSVVGIDLGVTNLATLSDGRVLGDLVPLQRRERTLRVRQRERSRTHRGSKRRRAANLRVAKAHQRLARTRKHQLDTLSRQIVNNNDTICVENLDTKQMVARKDTTEDQKRLGSVQRATGLRRNLHHAAHATLLHMLTYKAEDAGRRLIKVDPRGTSSTCSGCGAVKAKTLAEREHRCARCGLVMDRDHNAAINILLRGLPPPRRDSGLPGSVKREITAGCEALHNAPYPTG